MRLVFIFGVLVTAAPASAMDVATFLKQMEAVQKMGMRAMLSDQPKLLFGEMNAATASLRDERLAAIAAGRKPAYCPDPSDRAQPGEIIKALQAMPQAERGMELKEALRLFHARRSPCPAQ